MNDRTKKLDSPAHFFFDREVCSAVMLVAIFGIVEVRIILHTGHLTHSLRVIILRKLFLKKCNFSFNIHDEFNCALIKRALGFTLNQFKAHAV